MDLEANPGPGDVKEATFIPYGTLLLHDFSSIPGIGLETQIWNASSQLFCKDVLSQCSPANRQLLTSLDDAQQCGVVTQEHLLRRNCLFVRLYFIPSNTKLARRLRSAADSSQLLKAARGMSTLLKKVSTFLPHWSATQGASSDVIQNHQTTFQSISEIYEMLPSPCIDLELCGRRARTAVDSVMSKTMLTGMKTALYQYQRETIAKMIQKELHPGSAVDPLFLTLYNIVTKDVFYFQPTTLEVSLQPPLMAQPYGGILSEEMGTGKTCIILGLIISTQDQLPAPEESLHEPRPLLTPLSFNHFQTHDVLEVKTSFYGSNYPYSPVEPIPALSKLLIHQLRSQPELSKFRDHAGVLETYGLLEKIKLNVPFYLQSGISDFEDGRPSRWDPEQYPRRIFLSSATLVIVPPHLFAQWGSEIHKHCHDSALRVLKINSGQNIPKAVDLANEYDLVLMSHTRFTSEAKHGDTSKLYTWKPCSCTETPRAAVPKCSCSHADGATQLLSVRWKRVIIDEGHNVADHATNFTSLAALLSAERRWMVSGTPTSNLLGLGLGLGKTASTDVDTLPSENTSRWRDADRDDLRKLSSIMVHFLKVPQFASQPKLFSKAVSEPLLRKDGPAFGSAVILQQIMGCSMVRHRIADIEKEIRLPPLTHESITLDLDPFGLKTYNAIQSAVAVNAVDSDRTDKDYFFHPSNVGPLKAVITSLSQSLFWHGATLKVDETLHNARSSLQRASEKRVSESDCFLLEAAIKHLESAAGDAWWRAIQSREEVPFRIFEIPEALRYSWSRFRLSPTQIPKHETRLHAHSHSTERTDTFLHPDRLLKLRAALQSPEVSFAHVQSLGARISEEDNRAEQRAMARRKKGRKRNDDLVDAVDEQGIGLVAEKAKQAKKQVEAVRNSGLPETVVHDLTSEQETDTNTVDHDLLKIKLGESTSSKLNWIIREVSRYVMHEKFLIFSASPLTLAHVGDGLDVLGISYLTFTSAAERKTREQMPTTFETADNCRVILMELKHGARGLNLTAASRVIFCEPAWPRDVELQAIKRAHRIGQTKRIIVKTLVIRGTFEEAMFNCRNIGHAGGFKGSSVTEEPGMRHFLANPTFLDLRDDIVWQDDLLPLSQALPHVQGQKEEAQSPSLSAMEGELELDYPPLDVMDEDLELDYPPLDEMDGELEPDHPPSMVELSPDDHRNCKKPRYCA